jgi:hypothetical protein
MFFWLSHCFSVYFPGDVLAFVGAETGEEREREKPTGSALAENFANETFLLQQPSV